MLSLSERTLHPEDNAFYGIQKSLPIQYIYWPFLGKKEALKRAFFYP